MRTFFVGKNFKEDALRINQIENIYYDIDKKISIFNTDRSKDATYNIFVKKNDKLTHSFLTQKRISIITIIGDTVIASYSTGNIIKIISFQI